MPSRPTSTFNTTFALTRALTLSSSLSCVLCELSHFARHFIEIYFKVHWASFSLSLAIKTVCNWHRARERRRRETIHWKVKLIDFRCKASNVADTSEQNCWANADIINLKCSNRHREEQKTEVVELSFVLEITQRKRRISLATSSEICYI